MDIEKILQQEDEYFYKKSNEEKPKKKKIGSNSKKRTASAKKNKQPVYEEKSLDDMLSTDDEDELRDSIIDLIASPQKQKVYTETKKGFNFSFQKLQNELNQLLIKHNFNPENRAEAEAIGLFISNLNSIAKSY